MTIRTNQSQPPYAVSLSWIYVYRPVPATERDRAATRDGEWELWSMTHAAGVHIRQAGGAPIYCRVDARGAGGLSFMGLREDFDGTPCRTDFWDVLPEGSGPAVTSRDSTDIGADGSADREGAADIHPLGAGEFIRRVSPLVGAERAGEIVRELRRIVKPSAETFRMRAPWRFHRRERNRRAASE